MGFNLGLAAAAYQGVKDEQRRLRDDAFTQAQHDYATANMDEQTSRRPYRDNAAALADAQVQAQNGLLPEQTDVQRAALDGQLQNIPKQAAVQSATLDGALTNAPLQAQAATGALNSQIADQGLAESLRPQKTQAATLAADTAVKGAQTANDDATDVRNWSPIKRQENADKIDFAIANRPEVQSEYQDRVLAGIYAADQTGKVDEHAIVDRLNAVGQSKLFPELQGKKVADISVKGDAMIASDADGNQIASFPVARMKAAHDRLNPGKILTLPDGANVYKQGVDGTVTKMTDNKKTLASTGAGLGAAPRTSAQERLIATMKQEYTAAHPGKTLSTEDALVKLKADPNKWAVQLDKSDERLKYEKDPAKRLAIQNENRRAAGAAPLGGGTVANPGLGSISAESQAKINGVLGL